MVFGQLQALSCQRHGIAARASLSPTLGGAVAMGFEMTLIGSQMRRSYYFAVLPGQVLIRL